MKDLDSSLLITRFFGDSYPLVLDPRFAHGEPTMVAKPLKNHVIYYYVGV
jgi:hypothetical protein